MTVTWKLNDQGELRGFYLDEDDVEQEAFWTPQPGSQVAYLTSPVFEVLYESNRGSGKTDSLLIDFAMEVGQGWGADWRGILFRPEHVQLEEIINKSKELYPRIFPSATFNEGKSVWQWPTGEKFYFRHVKRLADYWKYHGHQYPYVCFDELTNWADDKLYRRMMSICRSKRVGIPIKFRSACNPSGVGHNWVKRRFKLPVLSGRTVGELITEPHEIWVNGQRRVIMRDRVAVHGDVMENRILLHAQPDYLANLSESASSPAELQAWLYGSWDITAGGMFDDLWNADYHVVPNIPFNRIPRGWSLDRSYDHGQSSPFSVGWWAESNGEPVEVEGRWYGQIPGDVFRVGEWYGWNGRENEGVRMTAEEIADGIMEREQDWGIQHRVRPGPADVKAFDPTNSAHSVEGDMRARGVKWVLADKSPNSRVLGWQQVRKMLKGAIPDSRTGLREAPGVFACERCSQYRRIMPNVPRSEKNMDDVDTEAEDHLPDEVRYRLYRKRVATQTRDW